MLMNNILNEPRGSEATIFSVQLYQQWKHHNAGKTDTLFIVYKDKENKKKVRVIKDPPMEIYFVNPEERDKFTTIREYIEIDKTYSKIVPAKKVIKTIYDELKHCTDKSSVVMKSTYDRAMITGNKSAAKEILKWPYTLLSDTSVEDYYRIMLGYQYNTMRNHIIDKAYLDIEADIYGLSSTEQASNMDKVNACTIIFNFDEHRSEKIKPKVFTFLLRDHKRYPQQKAFEDNLDKFIQVCHKEFDHQTVTKSGSEMTIDFVADYYIKMYDSEAELLVAIFQTINKIRPDLLSVWNIGYDFPKMAARMEMNGINYVDIMCDPAFPKDYRFVEMNIDSRPDIDIGDRKTYIRMASTTVFNDQMQSYAGTRKGRKAYGSNKLDNIARIELGVGKLNFGKGIDVTNAAIKDYWRFVLYNITDVMRQVLIDIVVNDGMAMVYDMNQANCPFENLFKQVRYQKQIYYTNYLRKGFVPGNNPNVNYIRGEDEEYLERLEEIRRAKELRSLIDSDDDDIGIDKEEDLIDNVVDNMGDLDSLCDSASQSAAESVVGNLLSVYNDSIDRELTLPGGLVADPDLNTATGVEIINGVLSKHIYDHVMDMDFASEYPWVKFTRSITKSTQLGRLIIPRKVSDYQNVLPMGQVKRIDHINMYLPGAEFTADYISGDILSFGKTWFNLPTVTEMNNKLQLKLKQALN